jgi:beta-phosphoglucomutase
MVAIKAVIYDVDGTMVNSEPLHVEAWDKALSLHNSGLTNLSDEFRATMAGKKPYVIAEEIVSELNLSTTATDLLREKTALFMQAAESFLVGMPDVVESVNLLKDNGYTLAIGTSLDRKYLDIVLEKLNIRDQFDVIVTGDQIKNGKPHPETYLTVAAQLELPPAQCLVLEDAQSGIQSAKAAGAWCIAVKNENAVAQNTSEADITISSLSELTKALIDSLS